MLLQAEAESDPVSKSHIYELPSISFSLIIFCYAASLITLPSSLVSLQFSSRTRARRPCLQMIMIMDNGKTSLQGRLEYGAVMRHRNPLLCAMAHTAFYLFYRWNIAGEAKPCFRQREQWYGLHLIKGENLAKKISLFFSEPLGRARSKRTQLAQSRRREGRHLSRG
jgi:hypothetical protein